MRKGCQTWQSKGGEAPMYAGIMVVHYTVLVFIFLIFNRFFAIHFRLLAIFGQGSTCCEIYLLIKDALRHPSYIVFFLNKLHAVPLKCSDIEYGGIFMVFLSCQNCGQECSDRAQRGKVFPRGKKQPALGLTHVLFFCFWS